MSQQSPILRQKRYTDPSLFQPENLLREAKRQKQIARGQIPSICILDPDGDIVQNLVLTGKATLNALWACYHTDLYSFDYAGLKLGIVGRAVGAPFAVLVAEELFASGCQFLISITSSGQVKLTQKPPFFVLIERALRDEGTSYHYLPPADYASISDELLKTVENACTGLSLPVYRGATWTTDAPFRETRAAIEYARSAGILAVEMEASALYAFAEARQQPVVCFAHVTNQLGSIEGDFEKGEADGSRDALQIIAAVAEAWMST